MKLKMKRHLALFLVVFIGINGTMAAQDRPLQRGKPFPDG